MQYHAPTKALTVKVDALEGAALALRHAIRQVRTQAGLPLEPHKGDVIMGPPQFAEAAILDAARYMGIDLGAQRHGMLDVRDAP